MKGVDRMVTQSPSTSKDLYSILNNLSHLTKINIYAYLKSQKIDFMSEFIPRPKFLPALDILAILSNHGDFHVQNQEVLLYTDEMSLNYLVIKCHVLEDEFLVMVGPFLNEIPDGNILNPYEFHNNYSLKEKHILQDYFSHIKILDGEYAYALAEILYTLINSPVTTPKIRTLKKQSPPLLEDKISNMNREELDAVNILHHKQKELDFFVAQGNQEQALKTLFTLPLNFREMNNHLSSSFVYSAIELNARLKMVADRAQVPPPDLYINSNKFIRRIENIDTPTLLFQVQKDIVISYCKLIRESNTKGFSKPIINAVAFIDKHLDRRVSLVEISQHLGINDSHLSRQFKKETGKNLTSYINERKITKAKHYLENSNQSITAISALCGFKNHNYFSKVFKLYTGYTPRAFQKNIPPKERTF